MSPKPTQDASADPVFMTVEEFRDLTSYQQHAVWAAAKHISTIPQGSILRYHREQVQALLGETTGAT